MGSKSIVVTGATVLGLAVGANQMLAPRTPEQVQQYQQEQQVENGSDAGDRDHERLREQLPNDLTAENLRELTPGEYRDVDPRLNVRFRP